MLIFDEKNRVCAEARAIEERIVAIVTLSVL